MEGTLCVLIFSINRFSSSRQTAIKTLEGPKTMQNVDNKPLLVSLLADRPTIIKTRSKLSSLYAQNGMYPVRGWSGSADRIRPASSE